VLVQPAVRECLPRAVALRAAQRGLCSRPPAPELPGLELPHCRRAVLDQVRPAQAAARPVQETAPLLAGPLAGERSRAPPGCYAGGGAVARSGTPPRVEAPGAWYRMEPGRVVLHLRSRSRASWLAATPVHRCPEEPPVRSRPRPARSRQMPPLRGVEAHRLSAARSGLLAPGEVRRGARVGGPAPAASEAQPAWRRPAAGPGVAAALAERWIRAPRRSVAPRYEEPPVRRLPLHHLGQAGR
jgi:hypothetical protein